MTENALARSLLLRVSRSDYFSRFTQGEKKMKKTGGVQIETN